MPEATGRRLAWLLLAALGLAVGWIGQSLSGSALWWLALPAAIGAGWLVWAAPTRCEARSPHD